MRLIKLLAVILSGTVFQFEVALSASAKGQATQVVLPSITVTQQQTKTTDPNQSHTTVTEGNVKTIVVE